MGLELAGLAAGFHTEVQETVDGVGANTWVLARAAGGSIGAYTGLASTEASAVAAEPGGDYNFRVGREFAEALGHAPWAVVIGRGGAGRCEGSSSIAGVTLAASGAGREWLRR